MILLTVAAIGLVLYRQRRQRPYSVAISNISMRETWTLWVQGSDLPQHERELRDALLRELDTAAIAATEQDLLRLENEEFSGKYPLTAIRKELMASVDRRMLNAEILRLPNDMKTDLRAQSTDVIQSDEQARRYLAANELRLQVLREYAARRFGDKAARDWFTVYEMAARMKQRNARALIEQTLAGAVSDGSNMRQQAISMVDSQLRMRLLQVPPGTEFPDIQTNPPSRSIH